MLLIHCDISHGLKGLIKGMELLGNCFCSQVTATSDRCAKPWCTLLYFGNAQTVCVLSYFVCTLQLTCPIELLGRVSFAIASMHFLYQCQRYFITRYPLILVGFSCSVAPKSYFQSLPEFMVIIVSFLLAATVDVIITEKKK